MVAPESYDKAKGTFDVVFATETPVRRWGIRATDWQPFMEILGLNEGEARLERFQNGAALLDNHGWANTTGMDNQKGSTVRGTARLEDSDKGRVGVVTAGLLDHKSNDRIRAGVEQGHFNSLSVGYEVFRYEDVTPDGQEHPRVLRAIDWEPYELSLTPVPADPGAKARSKSETPNPAPTMDEDENVEPKANNNPENAEGEESVSGERSSATATATPPKQDPKALRQEGIESERKRTAAIRQLVEISGLDPASKDVRSILEGELSVDQAREKLHNMRVDEQEKEGEIRSHSGVEVGSTEGDKIHEGIANAILYRAKHRGDYIRDDEHDIDAKIEKRFKLDENSRRFQSLDLVDLARFSLRTHGVRGVETMSKHDVARLAMRFRAPNDGAGMDFGERANSTGDFASILANVQHHSLRRAYMANRQTFRPLTNFSTASDFKEMSRSGFGGGESLVETPEGAKVTYGTIGEDDTKFKVRKFTRGWKVTGEAIVNDNLGAFARVPGNFGNAASRLESSLIWGLITSNPVMQQDGVQLFNAAHGNLGTASVININGLNAGMAAVATQRGIDNEEIDLEANFLVVPFAKQAVALQFTTATTPNAAGDVNVFAGMLKPMSERRLDTVSETAWYLVASPQQVEGLEMAHLTGYENGPRLTQVNDSSDFTMRFEAMHVVGVNMNDWRGWYLNPGL